MEMLAGKNIIIIGLGLIGGALAKVLVASKAGCRITGVDRDRGSLEKALEEGSIHASTTDLQTACRDADIVVLAVPVLAIPEQLQKLVQALPEKAILTDVTSVKGAVVDMVEKAFGSLPPNFVPGHPIAGSEQSGYAAATSDLFDGRKTILTPLHETSAAATALVRSLWQAAGAEVLEMTVERHDEVLAATSHLPHLLAFALVDTLSQQGESEEIFRYAAGGFRDFTRIASSDPVMWRDIFVTNGKATVAILDEYMADLQRLRRALLQGDGEQLFETFRRARQSREFFLSLMQQKNLKV